MFKDNRFFRAGFLIALCLIVIIVFLFIKAPGSVSKSKPINIALATWIGYAPFYICEEKGYFADEDIEVVLSSIDNLAARRAALSSGNLDAMVDTLDSLANGLPAGLKAKCVLKIDESYGGDGIVVTKEIEKIKDLKGKTVAYQKGLPPQFFLLYLLKKNGLSLSDIKSVDMEASTAAGAFIAKKVDAAVTWEPWLSQAGDSEHGKILITSKEAPGLIMDIFVVRPDVLSERKNDIRKVLKCWFRAIDFIGSNPDEAAKIMGEKLGIPLEEIHGMLMGLRFSSYEENLNFFKTGSKGSEFDNLLHEAITVWIEEGSVPKSKSGEVYECSDPGILEGLQ